jgi:2-hydroxychromene-2-carboxylate isomerase
MKKDPQVYFSFRSPFSWLAIESLRRAWPAACDRLEMIPFWEPDGQTASALAGRGAEIRYAPMSLEKHRYILQDTKRLAMRLGLRIAWPVDRDMWWELPHLGWLQARRLGRAAPFYDAIVESRWQRGENVCDTAVIRRLAESVGLDGYVIAAAGEDPAVRDEGVGCLARAYEDDIFGVPYFRVGWQRFWGFDRVGYFLEAIQAPPGADGHHDLPIRRVGPAADEPAGSEPVPEELFDQVGLYDVDTAGGCG